ncbi:MAG: RNA-directed DNA polymerase [Chloroflexi bacterium]|nr:RNA-directed DNA polymerase [Chloroflexota bacterium]
MTTNWGAALDLPRALENCKTDMAGDWYRDPWGWAELEWAVNSSPETIVTRLNARGVHRVARLDVPKENFATRPAIVMDPIDRVAYQALVDRVSVELMGDMKPWVFGWRTGRRRPERGHYADNGDEWENYRSRMSWLAGTYKFGLTTDVVSYFASVPIDRICDEIVGRCARGAPLDRLVEMLQSWARVHGRSGLPQRSMASAVLANFYLRPLDEVIHNASFTSRILSVRTATRWMDDIWLFGRDDGVLRKGQVEIEALLGRVPDLLEKL